MLRFLTFTRDHKPSELGSVVSHPTPGEAGLGEGQGQRTWTRVVPRLPPEWFQLRSCLLLLACLSLAGLALGIATRGRGRLPSAAGKPGWRLLRGELMAPPRLPFPCCGSSNPVLQQTPAHCVWRGTNLSPG